MNADETAASIEQAVMAKFRALYLQWENLQEQADKLRTEIKSKYNVSLGTHPEITTLTTESLPDDVTLMVEPSTRPVKRRRRRSRPSALVGIQEIQDAIANLDKPEGFTSSDVCELLSQHNIPIDKGTRARVSLLLSKLRTDGVIRILKTQQHVKGGLSFHTYTRAKKRGRKKLLPKARPFG